jgi:rubrerythrin
MKKFYLVLIAAILALAGCNSHKQTERNIFARIDAENLHQLQYDAFSAKAAEDTLQNASALFKALSKSQSIIIMNLNKIAPEKRSKDEQPAKSEFTVKSSAENIAECDLASALETSAVYPPMIEQAVKDSKDDVKNMFEGIIKIKNYQNELIKLVAANPSVKSGFIFEIGVCPVCGCVFDMSKASDTCPICGESKSNYLIFK